MRLEIPVVSVGTSKGIRIPKLLLEQYHIEQSVMLQTKGKSIIIKPVKKESRKGWCQSFRKMSENKDDKLLIDDSIDINMNNWIW